MRHVASRSADGTRARSNFTRSSSDDAAQPRGRRCSANSPCLLAQHPPSTQPAGASAQPGSELAKKKKQKEQRERRTWHSAVPAGRSTPQPGSCGGPAMCRVARRTRPTHGTHRGSWTLFSRSRWIAREAVMALIWTMLSTLAPCCRTATGLLMPSTIGPITSTPAWAPSSL